MPRSRHTSAAKQHNQVLFLRLINTLSITTEFYSTIESSGYQNAVFLNQIITTQASSISFTLISKLSNPLQYIVARLGTINQSLLSETSLYLLKLFQSTTAYGKAEHRH